MVDAIDDSDDDELRDLQRRLDRLVILRSRGQFGVADHDEYARLTRREAELLATRRAKRRPIAT